MTLFIMIGYGLLSALLYHLFPDRFRPFILLLLSYGFYITKSLTGLPFLIITTIAVYLVSCRIDMLSDACRDALSRLENPSREEKSVVKKCYQNKARKWTFFGLFFCFSLLFVFKYLDEILLLTNASPLGLLLPLGISFYTFSAAGYLLDVFHGKIRAERNFLRFAVFVSFFPQLIQGPIGRYDYLGKQLTNPPPVHRKTVSLALFLILSGLFRKLVIADRLVPFVSSVFDTEPSMYGGILQLWGVLAYAVQQYCDFSGGILLVTGIAKLFGISLAENFRQPYFSVSLADFWRRWHISLGAWMRDYVFYPFALSKPVSRLSKAVSQRSGSFLGRAIPAVLGNLLVFTLVGLWHGATTGYLAWGIYNGLVLSISALLEPFYKQANSRFSVTGTPSFHLFRILRTFIIVNIGWFLDRSATPGQAWERFAAIFTRFQDSTPVISLGLSHVDLLCIAVALVLLLISSLLHEHHIVWEETASGFALPLRWLLLIVGFVLVLTVGVWGSGFSEASFIYYQF